MTNEPSSKLVLSCDIVGSTAFKQRSRDWQEVFLSFYWDFPAALRQTCADVSQDLGSRFQLWKPLGDELLFTCDVTEELHVVDAIRAWLAAMSKFENESLAQNGLSTKGGAFIATTPYPDSRCSVPLTKDADPKTASVPNDRNAEALEAEDPLQYHYDYFGPSFDTGFRIISASTHRNFTLSVEVAWAMSKAKSHHRNIDEFKERVKIDDIIFVGTKGMKGVWSGREYPLFAIDRHHSDPVNEALSPFLGPELQADKIENICSACHKTPNWPAHLYLPDSPHPEFKTKPLAQVPPATKTHGVEDEAELPLVDFADDSMKDASTD